MEKKGECYKNMSNDEKMEVEIRHLREMADRYKRMIDKKRDDIKEADPSPDRHDIFS